MIGKTLSHYEITSKIGAGGMGEVYQAKDQKLGRDVAIKVLPEEFSKDTDRVARFEREAKLLASLNHPNIASIYGLEEAEGTNFLVLELIEGETLAERIKAGPIAVTEALKLSLQISEALEAAHEKGVIHRDLKPANIKITPEGKIKVLDFGLAKAFAGEQADLNLSNSPTLSVAATQQGVILGTAAYMSPEQAKGKTVDKRTDIWAFGVVLFEILTGKTAFQGDEISEILASVIKGDTNLDLLPSNIHQRIREVISRCLQKELRKRYPDIADARYEIEEVLADPGGVFVRPTTALKPREKMRAAIPWIATGLVLGAIISGVIVWKLQPAMPQDKIRYSYVLPEGQQFNYTATETGHTLAISPDGTQIVYSTTEGLYRLPEDQLDATPVAGTNDNPQWPFFSSDGQWVGYFSQTDKELKKIPVSGGDSEPLCDVISVSGSPIWYPDNTIVYASPEGIMRVSVDDETPELIEAGAFAYPQLLPDGKSLLYTDSSSQIPRIVVQDLESKKRKKLFAGWNARYVPTGHLIYRRKNNIDLFAIAFDLNKLEETGKPIVIEEGVGYYDISDSGTLVYTPNTANAFPERRLVWVNRDGTEEPIAAKPDAYSLPSISPDGKRLALTVSTGDNTDIRIWDDVRKTMDPLISSKGQDCSPLWSPDGKQIFFASDREDSWGVYKKAVNGLEEAEKLASPHGSWIRGLCWSDVGKTLVFEVGPNQGSFEIGSMPVDGERVVKSLLRSEFVTVDPHISPKGKWMAYMSNKLGRDEVYVCSFLDPKRDILPISPNGGDDPRWSPLGDELFYRSNDGSEMYAVAIETEPSFRFLDTKRLFVGSYYIAQGHNWDIHPDGKRFLMIKTQTSTDALPLSGKPREIRFFHNWFEELKEKAPVE